MSIKTGDLPTFVTEFAPRVDGRKQADDQTLMVVHRADTVELSLND